MGMLYATITFGKFLLDEQAIVLWNRRSSHRTAVNMDAC